MERWPSNVMGELRVSVPRVDPLSARCIAHQFESGYGNRTRHGIRFRNPNPQVAVFDATVRWGARDFSVYNHMYIPDSVIRSRNWNLVNDAILCDVAVDARSDHRARRC